MLARLAAHFAKLWSARGKATALGREGDGNESRRRSKHHTLRIVTIPPPSQSGGSTPPHSKVLRTKLTSHPFRPPARARCRDLIGLRMATKKQERANDIVVKLKQLYPKAKCSLDFTNAFEL